MLVDTDTSITYLYILKLIILIPMLFSMIIISFNVFNDLRDFPRNPIILLFNARGRKPLFLYFYVSGTIRMPNKSVRI